MTTLDLPPGNRLKRLSVLLNPQTFLAALIVAQLILFSATGTNVLTVDNAFETVRLSIEVGLLALALTPVIITAGIDLSVGSLLSLCAVLFGKMLRDAHFPLWAAIIGTLSVGTIAGLLNALLITRLRIPPLIVTLGTYSLFRGISEGITHGADNFTKFPASFISLGQGYFFNVIPNQLPLFLIIAAAFWLTLHRTTFGRALFAIGFSPEGARYAGIRVERRVSLVYVLSGLIASIAAMIYVARVGQAKADAGTGYELMAITAVVLGGTSIFGGRGSIHGTLLGLLAIAVLQRGLRLSDLPGELALILSGVLLLAAIGGNQLLSRFSTRRRPAMTAAP